ncbi:hypothetical protein D3C87_1831330 [compost metagenome]
MRKLCLHDFHRMPCRDLLGKIDDADQDHAPNNVFFRKTGSEKTLQLFSIEIDQTGHLNVVWKPR